MINEIYINDIKLTSEKNLPTRNSIKKVDIICLNCKSVRTLKIFRNSFFNTPYKCISCNKKGNNNPFYGKHHTDKSKENIGGASKNYSGINNPFYGKHHSKETIEKLKSNIKCFHIGIGNPFYGKHHTDESKEKIIEKNLLYRKNNLDIILENQLKNLNHSKNDFLIMLNDYINNPHNRKSMSDKYNIDFRTMQYYWLYFKFITYKELKDLKIRKKLYSNPSKPESDLYELLKNEYGDVNVKQNYEINGYYYDICLFNKFVIEYDGYYWHKIIKNKNDEIKNDIAKKQGYLIYRITENENRLTDLNKSLNDIKTLLFNNGVV